MPTHARARTHARTFTHARARTHARIMSAGRPAGRLAGIQACRQAGWLVGWGEGGGGRKAGRQKNFGVLLERARLIFCAITFAYMRPAWRLSRRDLEKVRPPSKVS
jgi:hypothetical protein